MNQSNLLVKIVLFCLLLVPVIGLAGTADCQRSLQKDFVKEAVDLVEKNRNKPYEILESLSQLMLSASKEADLSECNKLIDTLALETLDYGTGTATALKSALWNGGRGIDIALNMIKRWIGPNAELPTKISIHDFVMLRIQRTIHSTGSPMRVVEPFAFGELSAQKLLGSSHASNGRQILNDLEAWKSEMSELELRMLSEHMPVFMPGLLETFDSYTSPKSDQVSGESQ